ncbi:MAG: L,D-transpeptidase, partial [Pirellulaceae bacterium]
GTELKVVRGPFRASVSLVKNEMTLFLGHLYAGRFPISIGNNPSPRPGSYQVQLKQSGRPFYNASKQPIPVGDINNPYGNVWIDLGNNMSIHGTPRVATDANQGHSCIGLGAVDAQDIYGILTEGSQVIIRR